MSIGVNSVGTVNSTYTSNEKKVDNSNKTDNLADKTSNNVAAANDGVVLETGSQTNKATYSINKMSKEDRASLVKQLKADQDAMKQDLINIVNKAINKQAKTFTIANLSEDEVWQHFAKGDFEVDEQTKEQAKKDISEDGYWGVKQTAQRLFDFASALAGDDVDKMKQMQTAMAKGFGEAEKTWGRKLPEITDDTKAAANNLFKEYFDSKTKSE